MNAIVLSKPVSLPNRQQIRLLRAHLRHVNLPCETIIMPNPDMLPPTKAEMARYYDLVWLGQERHS